jgi:hypothetical protein
MIETVQRERDPGALTAEAHSRMQVLITAIRQLRGRFWTLVAFALLFLAVDVAVCYVFNASLAIGDLNEEPSWLDQTARAVASLMMATMVTAAVLTWHTAVTAQLGRGARFTVGGLAALLALGALLIAAAVAYPVFGELVNGLLNGAAPIPGAALPQTPLWVYLFGAVPVVAAGVMVGALELAALGVADKLASRRAELARCIAIVDNDKAALAAQQRQQMLEQERTVPQHLSQGEQDCRVHAVMARIGAMLGAYLTALEGSRPQLRDESALTQQQWHQQQQQQQRYDAARDAAVAMLDSQRLERMVRSRLMQPAQTLGA